MLSVLCKGSTRNACCRGCAWNRPIDELLEEEGVQVDSVRRYHFGTTYMVVARPGRRKEEK